MPTRKAHKRKTAARKKRQNDAYVLDALRQKVRAYEGISERRAMAMNADQCRWTLKHGKRRPFYPDMTTGAALSVAAATIALERMLRRTAR